MGARDGLRKARVAMSCSGKHAAMLLTCAVNDWPTEGYLDPDHPVQRQILAAVAEAAEPVAEVAVDGCGAPLAALSLGRLARACGRSPRRPRARSRHGSRAPTATTRSTSAGAGGCPPG
jgi:L-asparaginase II